MQTSLDTRERNAIGGLLQLQSNHGVDMLDSRRHIGLDRLVKAALMKRKSMNFTLEWEGSYDAGWEVL